MSRKSFGCVGLLLIAGAVYLLSYWPTDKPRELSRPVGAHALYLQADKGDRGALTRLIAAKGKEAGEYQEKMGDSLQWKDCDTAEKCWQAAEANGVQDGGPEWAYLYYLVKYWKLSVSLMAALLIFCCYLLFRKKSPRSQQQPRQRRQREQAPPPARQAKPQPQPQQQAPLPKSIPDGSVLLIDTNIWMDERLQDWFRNLPSLAKRHHWTLHIERIVLGELKGLSNNENKERAGNARMGMSRMESILELPGNRVQLEDNAVRGKDANADPVLIRMASAIPRAVIITNDRELRILAKSQGIAAISSAKL